MKAIAYNLSPSAGLLSHYPPADAPLVRDYTNPDYRKMLDNLAQSGDYLISLAAELDHFAVAVKKAEPKVSRSLIKLARDLSYIDNKYKIIKKPKNKQ